MAGIFKAYDVRGVYPDELDETTAYQIGLAFRSALIEGDFEHGKQVEVFQLFDRAAAEAWAIKAAIGPDCLARRQVVCQSCKEACGEGAIHFSLAPGRVPLPGLDAARCTGCGACVAVCPVDAITVAPLSGAEDNGAEDNAYG